MTTGEGGAVEIVGFVGMARATSTISTFSPRPPVSRSVGGGAKNRWVWVSRQSWDPPSQRSDGVLSPRRAPGSRHGWSRNGAWRDGNRSLSAYPRSCRIGSAPSFLRQRAGLPSKRGSPGGSPSQCGRARMRGARTQDISPQRHRDHRGEDGRRRTEPQPFAAKGWVRFADFAKKRPQLR